MTTDRTAILHDLLSRRILVLDGAMSVADVERWLGSQLAYESARC